MAEVKSVHLTALITEFYNTKTCVDLKKATRLQRIKTVLDVLETKSPACFSYEYDDWYNDKRPRPTFDQFLEATHYKYDEETLDSLIYYERDGFTISYNETVGSMRKRVIELLMHAGFAAHFNQAEAKLLCGKSWFLADLMQIESDENIAWLMFMGLKPNHHCYWRYGARSNRTFEQKKYMFERLHEHGVILPHGDYNIINYCYQYSKNIEEVKYFMKWFYTRGADVSSNAFATSFERYGMQMFEFLDDDMGAHRVMNLKQTLGDIILSNCPLEDKKQAFKWLVTDKSVLILARGLFDDAWETGDIELVKFVVEFGVPVEPDSVWRLLFHSKKTRRDKKLEYDYVVDCLKLALSKHPAYPIPYEISVENNSWMQFQDSSKYCFDGRLYDWMMDNHPPMKVSVSMQKKVDAEKAAEEKRFVDQHGITQTDYILAQERAKERGVCLFFHRSKQDSKCHFWPRCPYYHGPMEKAYRKEINDPNKFRNFGFPGDEILNNNRGRGGSLNRGSYRGRGNGRR